MTDRLPLRSAVEVARQHLREFDERVTKQEALLARLGQSGRSFLVAEARTVLTVTKALRAEAAARLADLERDSKG